MPVQPQEIEDSDSSDSDSSSILKIPKGSRKGSWFKSFWEWRCWLWKSVAAKFLAVIHTYCTYIQYRSVQCIYSISSFIVLQVWKLTAVIFLWLFEAVLPAACPTSSSCVPTLARWSGAAGRSHKTIVVGNPKGLQSSNLITRNSSGTLVWKESPKESSRILGYSDAFWDGLSTLKPK